MNVPCMMRPKVRAKDYVVVLSKYKQFYRACDDVLNDVMRVMDRELIDESFYDTGISFDDDYATLHLTVNTRHYSRDLDMKLFDECTYLQCVHEIYYAFECLLITSGHLKK